MFFNQNFEFMSGIFIIIWLIYKWWIKPYSYWKNRGFPYIDAKFPYGSSKELVEMKEYTGSVLRKLYEEIGERPYAGIVVLRRTIILLKDPEIIKTVMLKDFHYFTDRISVDYINEPSSHHIFNLGGDKWKALRVKLTPTFTSGKLKAMFSLLENCSKSLEQYLDKVVLSKGEVDVKEALARYTTKIIGTCVYGINVDTLEDEENMFVKISQGIFLKEIPPLFYAIEILQGVFPEIQPWLRYRSISYESEQYLESIIMEAMNHRQKNGFKRNDFIDLMMEIKTQGEITVESIENKGQQTINISDNDIVSQAFVFLAAGFETTSSVSTYCLFELAENPDIQDRLRKEILAMQHLTYQNIQKLEYLDMVICETLRKYPTLHTLSRKCTKPYRMPDGTVIEKNTRLLIPLFALHHDPKYFPQPEKFDPERFTQEERNSRTPFCYLPFGDGPRVCIGLRFGMLQVKMAIATIISRYEIKKTHNTISPLQFSHTSLITTLLHPVKLGFNPL